MSDADASSNDASEGSASSGRNTSTVAAIGVAAATTIGGFAYLFSVWAGNGSISDLQTIRLASAQYVAGNVIVAGELASTVDLGILPTGDDAELPPELGPDEEPAEEPLMADSADSEKPLTEAEEWLPLQQFLIGAGKHQRAMEEISPRDRRLALEEALPYLEMAEELGFPAGREAEGYRLIGEVFYYLGQYKKATNNLQRAIELDLTLENKLLPLLAESRALQPQSDLVHAIESLDEYLSDPSLDDRRRGESQRLRVEWLIQTRQFEEAGKQIVETKRLISDGLTLQEPWALSIRDELALQEGLMLIRKTLDGLTPAPGQRTIAGIPIVIQPPLSETQQAELEKTTTMLQGLQREASPKVAAKARLVAAKALLLASEPNLALAELTQVRQQRPFGDEGLLGGIAELEVLAEQNLGDDVLQTARYIVREARQTRHLNFTQQKEDQFRTRVSRVLGVLRAGRQYKPAVDLAESISGIFGPSASLNEKGLSYREWGITTLQDGRGPGGVIARDSFEQARQHFREAGDAFAAAAKAQFDTEDYVSTLWSAIDSYQRGRHFSKSIPLLENYLRYEERKRQPRGLVAHGRALLADGRPAKAIDSLQTCIIEFPRDPMRYEARLLGAQAAADSHDLTRAEELLRDNLNDGELTPQSPVWRKSLLTLGEMLYSTANLSTMQALDIEMPERIDKLREVSPQLTDAIRTLAESVDRYWPDPRTQSAAYLLARSQLLAAELPKAELQQNALLDTAQRDLRQRTNQYRQDALDRFGSLIRYMDSRQDEKDLSDQQQAILRNSLLGQADSLKEMKRYIEAADVYRDMSLRYMNEPPALEALLGQSRMMRELGRDQEADLLIQQAIVVLDRIDVQWDDRFDETTRFDREAWRKYLTWMNQRIEQANKRPANERF